MKQCEKCGNQIEEDAAFCTRCGAPTGVVEKRIPVEGPEPNSENGANGFAPTPEPASNPAAPVVEKKKNKGVIIALIVACVICLIVGVVGIVLALNSGKKGDPVANNGGDSGSTVDVVTSGTKVQYKNYEFVIPDGYTYEVYEENGAEVLAFSDNEYKYMIMLEYSNDITFASVESSADAIAERSTQAGEPAVKGNTTVDGIQFLYFDVTLSDGEKVIYAFSPADLYTFSTMIITADNTFGHEYFENAALILNSAKKKTGANRAFGDGSIPRSGFTLIR